MQAVGERQEKAEKDLINSFNENKLSGSREIPVLFEEADGLWLSMQGKSRKKTSTSMGKRELKIGVMYEGWEKRYASSKEYKTVGKTAFKKFGYQDYKTRLS